MPKGLKKAGFSLFLALFLVFSFAAQGFAGVAPVFEERLALSAPRRTQTGTSVGFTFFSQLSGNAVDAYEALVEYKALAADDPSTAEVAFTLSAPIIFTADTSDPTPADMEAAFREMGRASQSALDAFFTDHPDVFWFVDSPPECSVYISRAFDSDLGKYVFTIYRAKYTVGESPTYGTGEQLGATISALKEAVASVPVAGVNRYEKVRVMHDYLAEQITYDHGEPKQPWSYEATGALLNGLSVCEGYAESMKLLCDYYGIPCILVRGYAGFGGALGFHMWNAVQMEDGKWYLVDITWDDQEDRGTYYDFFLVGTETEDIHFGGSAFADSHLPSGIFSTGDTIDFDYPAFSTDAYVLPAFRYGDVDNDGLVDISDLTVLAKSIAGWNVPIQAAAADVNDDQLIDISDLTVLAKAIAGWNVTLGPQAA